jgi:hypothetical protein
MSHLPVDFTLKAFSYLHRISSLDNAPGLEIRVEFLVLELASGMLLKRFIITILNHKTVIPVIMSTIQFNSTWPIKVEPEL